MSELPTQDPGHDDYEMSEEQYRTEVARILRDYQGQQLRLHLIGPAISLVLHLILLAFLSWFMVGGESRKTQEFVVESIQLEVTELEDEILEELEETELDTEIVEEAPEVEMEDIPEPVVESDDQSFEDVGEMLDDAPLADSFGEMAVDTMLTISDSVDTPLKLEGLYAARSGAGRSASVQRFGGSARGQQAVEKALAWLAKVQNPDGSWPGPNSAACTGMALLVFLAHGETPLSEKYGQTVQNGMKWLANAMMQSRGPCGGRAYSHGIATYALAEAYGMTRIPFLKSAMEKGLDVIVKGQQDGGGFDYNYKKAERWDLSVAGWQYQALKAGVAAGSTNPGLNKAVNLSIKFLKDSAYKNKKFGYASPGSGGNMTGVGTVALQLLGERDSPQARGGVETIALERLNLYMKYKAGKADFKAEAGHHIYGWYYDTQAMFNTQGKEWRAWQGAFEDVLVRYQHSEGYWSFEKGHGFSDENDGMRVLSTCWCALQLEVYYRYLPTYDIKKMDSAKAAAGLNTDDSGLIIR